MATNCFADLPGVGAPAPMPTWPRPQTLRVDCRYRRQGECEARAAPGQFLGTPRNNAVDEWQDGMVSQGWIDSDVLYYTTSHHRPGGPFGDIAEFVNHLRFDPFQAGNPPPGTSAPWLVEQWVYTPTSGWQEQEGRTLISTICWTFSTTWLGAFVNGPIAITNRSTYQGVPNTPAWVESTLPIAGPVGLPWPPVFDESFWP